MHCGADITNLPSYRTYGLMIPSYAVRDVMPVTNRCQGCLYSLFRTDACRIRLRDRFMFDNAKELMCHGVIDGFLTDQS